MTDAVGALPEDRILAAGRFRFRLDRPLIMGILNVTPDSFSDGGRYVDPDLALTHAHRLISEGADLLDIGGESTRPGADAVDAEEELRRILPIVKALAPRFAVSVDTCKPSVMRAVLPLGVVMINDVRALQAPGALDAVANTEAAVCLMHMQGSPRTMQHDPHYEDVVQEVAGFLRERALAAEAAGISRQRILIDPGFGFGKSRTHNLSLLRHLADIGSLGWPVLAGISRKSVLGQIVGRELDDRLHASVAAALLAVAHGAAVVRVHDVAATRDALQVLQAVVNKM